MNGRNSCPEAEFLDEIQTKTLRVFILAIHSHLCSFALRFIFLQTHATSSSFYSSFTIHKRKEENLIGNYITPPYGVRNPYRNLKSKNSQETSTKLYGKEFGFWVNKIKFSGVADQGLYCNDETILSASGDTLSKYLYYVLFVINTVQFRNTLYKIHPL